MKFLTNQAIFIFGQFFYDDLFQKIAIVGHLSCYLIVFIIWIFIKFNSIFMPSLLKTTDLSPAGQQLNAEMKYLLFATRPER